MTITFNETGSAENYNQGKSFSGKLYIGDYSGPPIYAVTFNANASLLSYTGNCTLNDDGSDNYYISFTTSGTLTIGENLSLDVFAAGGGALCSMPESWDASPQNGGVGGSGGGASGGGIDNGCDGLNASANTAGGGGGAGAASTVDLGSGGNGGSGIVMIRNAR